MLTCWCEGERRNCWERTKIKSVIREEKTPRGLPGCIHTLVVLIPADISGRQLEGVEGWGGGAGVEPAAGSNPGPGGQEACWAGVTHWGDMCRYL